MPDRVLHVGGVDCLVQFELTASVAKASGVIECDATLPILWRHAGVQLVGAIEINEGLFDLVASEKQHSALFGQIGGLGIALNRFAEVGDGPFGITGQTAHLGPQVPGPHILGLLLQEGAQGGNGVGGVPLAHEGHGPLDGWSLSTPDHRCGQSRKSEPTNEVHAWGQIGTGPGTQGQSILVACRNWDGLGAGLDPVLVRRKFGDRLDFKAGSLIVCSQSNPP